jgi:hypothetical protein
MRHASLSLPLALCALLPATIRPARAQQEPYVPVFNQLFKQSTGLNGMEDLVMAGDIVRGNPALAALQDSVSDAAPLSAKRRALATPEAQQALALIRSGLAKRITSPHDKIDYSTTLPEYGQLRALARLLMAEQYVLLADGQIETAIQNLRDGLRLGQAARIDHLLISELVGIAIDRICITPLLKHLDQFSEHDCDSLLKLLEEWRGGAIRSAIPSLLREREAALAALEQIRTKPEAIIRELFGGPADVPDEAERLVTTLTANPGLVGQAVDEAASLVRQNCDALIASLQLPPWQRPEVKAPEGKSPGYKLYDMIAPSYDQVLSKFTQDDVNMQLLAVHVAIRRYQWQYDRLPDRLEELRLDELTTDPFTGKPLVYQRKGADYDLSSAGGYDHDENGARIPGKRTAINLPH